MTETDEQRAPGEAAQLGMGQDIRAERDHYHDWLAQRPIRLDAPASHAHRIGWEGGRAYERARRQTTGEAVPRDERLLDMEQLQAIHARACDLQVSGYVGLGTVLLAMERHIDALAEQIAAEGRAAGRSYINHAGERVTYHEAVQEAIRNELDRHTQAVAKILTPPAAPATGEGD